MYVDRDTRECGRWAQSICGISECVMSVVYVCQYRFLLAFGYTVYWEILIFKVRFNVSCEIESIKSSVNF